MEHANAYVDRLSKAASGMNQARFVGCLVLADSVVRFMVHLSYFLALFNKKKHRKAVTMAATHLQES